MNSPPLDKSKDQQPRHNMTTIQGDGFTVDVIKSKRRKTVALKVNAKGVFVYMPARLALHIAQDFVQQKTSWIKQKLQQQSQQIKPQRQFINGELFHYLGAEIELQLVPQNSVATITKTDQQLILAGRLNRLSITGIRTALINWYKQQAKDYLTQRTEQLGKQIGLYANSITIKTYKARWGSCTIHADINYNWQLIQAPPAIIDYVIIHELCHIKHHNHARPFWQLVEQHYPHHKTAQQWLKEHRHQLAL